MTGETWQQLADQIIAKRGSAGMVRSLLLWETYPMDANQEDGLVLMQILRGLCRCNQLHKWCF